MSQYLKLANFILKSFYRADRQLYKLLNHHTNKKISLLEISAMIEKLTSSEYSWNPVTLDQFLALSAKQHAALYKAVYFDCRGHVCDEAFDYVTNKGDLSQSLLENISKYLLTRVS